MTIIAVTGLAREARIAKRAKAVPVIGAGDAALLARRLEDAIAAGAKELYEQCVAGNLTESMFRQSFTRLAQLKSLRESGAVDDSLRPVTR